VAAFEFFVEALDGVRRTRRLPLARGQPGEGEQPISGFLQAVGNGPAFQPPFADERFAAGCDLLRCAGIDHVVVIGRDFVVQTLREVLLQRLRLTTGEL